MKRSTPAIAAVLALAFPFLVSSPAFAEDAPSIEATAVQASDRSVAAINTWLPIDGTVQSVTGPVIVTGGPSTWSSRSILRARSVPSEFRRISPGGSPPPPPRAAHR